MDDGTALLAAILAQPRENTPRLMYADYLDENGTGDLAAATSEYIRLSCTRVFSDRWATYNWIGLNWHRLVRRIFRHHTQRFQETHAHCIAVRHSKSRVTVELRFVHSTPWRTSEDIFALNLWFDRGFLNRTTLSTGGLATRKIVYEELARDQPLWALKRVRGVTR